MNLYIEDLLEAEILLRECLAFINQVPNGKYPAFPYKNSYELASKVGEFLKLIENEKQIKHE